MFSKSCSRTMSISFRGSIYLSLIMYILMIFILYHILSLGHIWVLQCILTSLNFSWDNSMNNYLFTINMHSFSLLCMIMHYPWMGMHSDSTYMVPLLKTFMSIHLCTIVHPSWMIVRPCVMNSFYPSRSWLYVTFIFSLIWIAAYFFAWTFTSSYPMCHKWLHKSYIQSSITNNVFILINELSCMSYALSFSLCKILILCRCTVIPYLCKIIHHVWNFYFRLSLPNFTAFNNN